MEALLYVFTQNLFIIEATLVDREMRPGVGICVGDAYSGYRLLSQRHE